MEKITMTENNAPITPRSGMRLILILGMVIVGLLAVDTAPGQARSRRSHGGEGGALGAEAAEAARIINQIRTQAGLHPLAVHPLLNLAVQHHIQDMITSGRYGHSGSDGSNVHQRIARTGYVIDGWAGENWAVRANVDASIQWWMADPPHRRNVLNANYKEMGLATHPHPRGWGLILVVDFTTGSSNQDVGAVPESTTPDSTMDVDVAQETIQQPVEISVPLPAASGEVYTVQQGDTLWTISAKHGVSWEDLARLNNLSGGTVLQIDTQLQLPAGTHSVDGANSPGTDLSQQTPETDSGVGHLSSRATDSTTTNSAQQIHTVSKGETIWSIAAQYGMNWQQLANHNNQSADSLLQIGEELEIPPSQERFVANSPTPRTHTVQSGETLWSIAVTYDVDWQSLMDTNGFNEETLLSVGQEIRLP